MSENEVDVREIQIEKKDVTDEVITDEEIEKLIGDEELEEEALAEAGEVEEEKVDKSARRSMSEDEFLERVEEFEEKNHGLTLMLDRFFKLLKEYGKKYGVEVDLELWNEVAKPSLNVGFWYYQLVEGQNIMVSYPKFSLAIGVLATVFVGLGALVQIRNAKNKQKSKEELKEKAKAGIEGKKENKELKERQIKNREKIEELKANSDLLARVRKNLNSS